MHCVSCFYFVSLSFSLVRRRHHHCEQINQNPRTNGLRTLLLHLHPRYEHSIPSHSSIQLMIAMIIIITTPSVSYDTRDTNAKTASHWRDEELLGDRAVFRAGREPAELIINPVRVINSFIIINDYKLYRIYSGRCCQRDAHTHRSKHSTNNNIYVISHAVFVRCLFAITNSFLPFHLWRVGRQTVVTGGLQWPY